MEMESFTCYIKNWVLQVMVRKWHPVAQLSTSESHVHSTRQSLDNHFFGVVHFSAFSHSILSQLTPPKPVLPLKKKIKDMKNLTSSSLDFSTGIKLQWSFRVSVSCSTSSHLSNLMHAFDLDKYHAVNPSKWHLTDHFLHCRTARRLSPG